MSYLTLLAWLIFAALSGAGEAWIAKPGRWKYKIDPHLIYSGVRLIVGGLFLFPMWPDLHAVWVHTWVMLFIFPFPHDGVFYETWGRLHPEIKDQGFHFFGSPKSRGAWKIDPSLRDRVALVLISILIIIEHEIFH